MNIAEKRRNMAREKKTLYQRAAEKFNTDYEYVSKIARGIRKGSRGKGKLIREYLEEELKKGEIQW